MVRRKPHPTPEAAQRLYDEADLNRAIQAYRFFFPNVSIAGMYAGFKSAGANLAPNRAAGRRTWEDFLAARMSSPRDQV